MADEQEVEVLTPEERELLLSASIGANPLKEDKHNAHTFLNAIANSKDTTKTGNLEMAELGVTAYALRSYMNMKLISNELCTDSLWGNYFAMKGEILTSSSLSKNGFLTGLAVVQKRQIEDVTIAQPKPNKGWFTKKGSSDAGVTK
jgi:hypothetical protein